jgi:hypothetical protein
MHWRTPRVVRRCPMSRQSVPAGPLARTDDPQAFVATLRDPAPQTSLRGRGFYCPASLPHNRLESLRPYIPPGAPTTRYPAETIPHPYPSGAIEPCYVVLPTSVLPSCDPLLTSCCSLLLLAAVRLTSRFLFLTSHCGTALLTWSLNPWPLSCGSALYPHTEIRTSR